MINCVKLVTISVSNQDRALAFYTEKLGFKLVMDTAENDNRRWLELQTPMGNTHVVLSKAIAQASTAEAQAAIVFGSDDLEKTYFELKVKGVQFKHPPKKQTWGSYTEFSDPDGNVFVLASL